jgi:hypothetical protein
LLRCIPNWNPWKTETKTSDQKNPFKDFIDGLRYFFGVPLYYSDPEIPEVVGGRGWGV